LTHYFQNIPYWNELTILSTQRLKVLRHTPTQLIMGSVAGLNFAAYC